MDQVLNPYNPGAGTRPYELSGRSDEITAMGVTLQRLLIGRNGRSQFPDRAARGRQDGPSQRVSLLAGNHGYIHEHIEISEDGQLPKRLAARPAQGAPQTRRPRRKLLT